MCDTSPIPQRRRALTRRLGIAAIVGGLLLVASAGPADAQLAAVTFPDTSVGSTATVKCPNTAASLCFGSNCSASGTIQSVSGPAAPFSISKFNLLSTAEFFAGNCEAHPVTLPVTVGPGQVFAYQATFAPTDAGNFHGTITFTTGGGPAAVALDGKGVPRQHGGVLVQVNPEDIVPGGLFNLQYQTTRGTLQRNVDLYFLIVTPSGEVFFLNEQGGLTGSFAPFRRNFAVTDTTYPLAADQFPLDLAFGTYAFHMALVYAGADPGKPENFASPISSATLSYAPLTPEQSQIKSTRGNPDLLVVLWLAELKQKQETWLYLGGSPNKFVFVNGTLTSQTSTPLLPSDVGPKVDPAVFTPKTTLATLTSALGALTSVAPSDGGPEYQLVHYASGIDVVLLNGRLNSAITSRP